MTDLKETSRREFLKFMGRLASSGAIGAIFGTQRALAKSLAPGYRVSSWTGDDFSLGHRLRDGDLPTFPESAERSVDFIIVGGGIAGLSAAYKLRSEDFLLLEQYEQLGGEARSGNYKGIQYSLGSAYFSSNADIYMQLFGELGIKPIELPTSRNAWHFEDRWIPGYSGSDQNLLYGEFKKLIADFEPLWKTVEGGELHPLSSKLAELDSQTFSNLLKSYDPKFVSLMNSFCRSSYCGGADQISALTGIYAMHDWYAPSYVFRGGNPSISQALTKALDAAGNGRCQTKSFVWRIDVKDKGASVVYSDKSGNMHRVNCKHVIVCTPPLVAARQCANLPDELKAQLLSCKFGAYLVANFCMPKKVFDGSYDNYVDAPFSFTDFITAETPYMASGEYKPEMGSVLTMYHPYASGSEGRTQMQTADRKDIAAGLVDEMTKLIPHFQDNLDEVVLTRWGHAMVIPRPGTMKRIETMKAIDTGSLTLAHNSMYGLPSAESAISAGTDGARRAMNLVGAKA